jgi:hypothetical protein
MEIKTKRGVNTFPFPPEELHIFQETIRNVKKTMNVTHSWCCKKIGIHYSTLALLMECTETHISTSVYDKINSFMAKVGSLKVI